MSRTFAYRNGDLRLSSLILQTLLEGDPVTARDVSRRWGEDVVRCREWLDRFTKLGLCKPESASAANRRRRGGPALATDRRFVPRPRLVADHIARNP